MAAAMERRRFIPARVIVTRVLMASMTAIY